jgi:hypothetical protein
VLVTAAGPRKLVRRSVLRKEAFARIVMAEYEFQEVEILHPLHKV